jgi:hypothetical protein
LSFTGICGHKFITQSFLVLVKTTSPTINFFVDEFNMIIPSEFSSKSGGDRNTFFFAGDREYEVNKEKKVMLQSPSYDNLC